MATESPDHQINDNAQSVSEENQNDEEVILSEEDKKKVNTT